MLISHLPQRSTLASSQPFLLIVVLSFMILAPLGHLTNTTAAASSLPSKIAFASERDGNGEIYIMNPDGTRQVNLTLNPVWDFVPSWSPDGGWLTFDSNPNNNWDIYVMQADGGEVTRLTSDSHIDRKSTWSPDGKHIAFESDRDGDWNIYVMNTDGTGQTRLTNHAAEDRQPAWSPDGTHIAFVSNRGGNHDIYMMNADGTAVTALTNDPMGDWSPAWSPDSSRIAFVSYRSGGSDIYVMNADGTGQTRLTTSQELEDWPAWSPDGAAIVFESERDGNQEIYVMDAQGAGQTRLTFGGAKDIHPAWSPALQPAISELSPNTAVANAGDVSMAIRGKNLREPVSVRLGNLDLASVTLESSTLVRAVVPVGSLGKGSYTLTVTIDGNPLTLPNAFTVLPYIPPTQFRVMVYLACDNNLESSCYELVNHLEEAMLAAPDLRIAILWDGQRDGDSSYYLVQPDGNPVVWANYTDGVNRFPLGEVDTGNMRTLADFLGWSQSQYPGQYKMLSLVGHGGGWAPDLSPGQPRPARGGQAGDVGGMLWDEHSESSMATSALAEALASASKASPIDVLYLDACLMSTVEIAAELAPVTQYLIAHENWTWAFFPYDGYLRDVSSSTTPLAFATRVANINRQYWTRNEYPSQISVIDTSKVPLVLNRLDDLTQALSTTLTTNRELITDTVEAAAHVDENADMLIDPMHGDDLVDLGDLAVAFSKKDSVDASVRSAASQLVDAITATLVIDYKQSGTPWVSPGSIWNLDQLHGLSIYLPLNDEWKRPFYSAAALPRFAAETSWDDFVQALYLGHVAPAPPLGDSPPPPGALKRPVFLPIVRK